MSNKASVEDYKERVAAQIDKSIYFIEQHKENTRRTKRVERPTMSRCGNGIVRRSVVMVIFGALSFVILSLMADRKMQLSVFVPQEKEDMIGLALETTMGEENSSLRDNTAMPSSSPSKQSLTSAKDNPLAASTAIQLPPECTPKQMETIKFQLPPDRCENTAEFPWRNECSFSYATRSPDSIWLKEYYASPEYLQSNTPRRAVYVGCSNGMNAVGALRMLSRDDKFDKETWRSKFSKGCTVMTKEGDCRQEDAASQIAFDGSAAVKKKAFVHCIETEPTTSKQLNATATSLNWQNHLRVMHATMSGTDSSSETVPTHRLDTYIKQHFPDGRIDVVSIGGDPEVLKGASMVLSRIGYLEFEYNWKGSWPKETLAKL
jgi:hypothetical protein